METFIGQARLPKFATPKRYDIKLKPDLSACTFAGTLVVELDVVLETKFLVLNATELVIGNSSVVFKVSNSDKEICPKEIVLVEDDEILILGFDEFLPLGRGALAISFEGTLNDKMRGFYRSTYEYNGEKRNMAVTQFEAADARRCFPCWDEPAFKATFKITLEVPSQLVALSNMPVLQEKLDGQLKTVTFQESPVMSTYLVAVVIGLLDYVEAFTPEGTSVRVYCQVGKANLGKFALDVAVRTLDLYKVYFSLPYSLPKLDMVAIPDFALGAMENYGLVTYRETALLYDDQNSAAVNKQRIAIVVAHELAHQWFGNLVTMEWWTHLWLNEGFATWVSYLAADHIFPDWKVWTQFLNQTAEGLRLDGLAESHPIEVEVNHAREIDEIFDAISYRKGASVIRMLQNYLGPESFQRSLASYIKKYASSNAKTEDLWAVLEEESGEPVKMIMSSWTKQKGYPVVYVKMKEAKLEFEQSHFLSSGHDGDGQWIVPITVCFGSYSTRKSFLLQKKIDNLGMVDLISSSGKASLQEKGSQGSRQQDNPDFEWVKLNIDQTGFYRVQYDDELAARLRYAVEAGCLSATDRFGILDDSFALCMAGKQTLSSLLFLMNAYREESDYTVLSCLIEVTDRVAKLVADALPELSNDVIRFFINLLQISAEKFREESRASESHLEAMLRGELLIALVEFGYDVAQTEALRRFKAFLDDRNTALLPPDTRKGAYVAVMRTVNRSDRSGYESLLRIYRETDLSTEKVRVLSSLAYSPDPEIVLEVLNFFLTSEVRSQDIFHGLYGISAEGREIAWKWLKDNWDHISKTWSGLLLARFVGAIVSPFSSDEKADEAEEFFSCRMNPAMVRTLKQSIERVRIKAKWVQSIRNEKDIAEVVKELAYRKY
ncbi:aminopeptidase M1 [Aristolochia californica]|uniref:aminopeptidase M1 n=1 Tax=Aristolochia californica TaxID=171875 RepID=UPI0035DA72A7